MPPPSLNRRPSMPLMTVSREEPSLERTRSLAVTGRSPTMSSIRSARQRAGSTVVGPMDPMESSTTAAGTTDDEGVVRPPSRVASMRSDAAAPALAPQKVLVKKLKSASSARRQSVPPPASLSHTSFGAEADHPQQDRHSYTGSSAGGIDSDTQANTNTFVPSYNLGNGEAPAAQSGGEMYFRGSGGDGGEAEPVSVAPISLNGGSGGEDERTGRAANDAQHIATPSEAVDLFPHHSRTSSAQQQQPIVGTSDGNRGSGGDVQAAPFQHHWSNPVVEPSASDTYNPSRPVGTVQSQRMMFESIGFTPPSVYDGAATRPQGSNAPPPPPPPPSNWKPGDSTPRGGATPPAPAPAPLPPPPPRRVDNYDIDEKPLPDAASVRIKVEQLQARELARLEEERLQQPGRPSITTVSRLDLSGRHVAREDDDGQYSLATEDVGGADSARSVDDSHSQDQPPVPHGGSASGGSGGATNFGSSARNLAPSRSSASERRHSPKAAPHNASSVGRGSIPVSPVAFSIEFDGMSAVLLDQLSDASLNKIVDEIQSILFDAVRGPVVSKGSVRIERILASDDSETRTVVEGTMRGMRSTADRRLSIRLLVSFFRGPTADSIGNRLSQFPSLIRDASSVKVRRMYINDVDVVLVSTGNSNQTSPTFGQQRAENATATLAAFEARRTKLSMTTTPSIVSAEFHSNGTPREVSPQRYPDRSIYHHISAPPVQQVPVMARSNLFADASMCSPHQPHLQQQTQTPNGQMYQPQPGHTDVTPYYSPSNNYGVTRYRTRKYEYH